MGPGLGKKLPKSYLKDGGIHASEQTDLGSDAVKRRLATKCWYSYSLVRSQAKKGGNIKQDKSKDDSRKAGTEKPHGWKPRKNFKDEVEVRERSAGIGTGDFREQI